MTEFYLYIVKLIFCSFLPPTSLHLPCIFTVCSNYKNIWKRWMVRVVTRKRKSQTKQEKKKQKGNENKTERDPIVCKIKYGNFVVDRGNECWCRVRMHAICIFILIISHYAENFLRFTLRGFQKTTFFSYFDRDMIVATIFIFSFIIIVYAPIVHTVMLHCTKCLCCELQDVSCFSLYTFTPKDSLRSMCSVCSFTVHLHSSILPLWFLCCS